MDGTASTSAPGRAGHDEPDGRAARPAVDRDSPEVAGRRAGEGDTPGGAPGEHWLLRLACVVLALGVVATFLYATRVYLVPVHSGVDQNGYLVGARQIAATGTMKLRPTLPGTGELDIHQHVGRMWVGADLLTDRERFYPKYPIGLPLLYAGALRAGGPERGIEWVYWVNPVAMAGAAGFTFLIGRRLGGSVAGLVAMILFATAPATLALTTNPNSHATAAFFAAGGMNFLLAWWDRRGLWRAMLAGLMLGYAVTIRYTEGTLLLPLLLVAGFSLFPRDRRSWKAVAVLVAAWAVPVGGLVAYNLAAMGTITGYDPTNESVGFSLQYALDNWETMLRQLATFGLFFALPLSVAGAIGMFWWDWRRAMVMAAWVLPCLAIYTFYYWAPDTSSVGYVRFFLTVMPAVCVAAAWACRRGVDFARAAGPRSASAVIASAGAVIAIAACAQLEQGLAMVEADMTTRLGLQTSIDRIDRSIPEGSAIFCSEQGVTHHLQFMRNDALYNGETFQRGYVAGLMNQVAMDEPQGLDPQRRAALWERLKDFDQRRLDGELMRVIEAYLSAGRRVFFVLPLREGGGLPVRATTRDDDFGRRAWPDALRRWQRAGVFDVNLVAAWNVPTVRPWQDRSGPRPRRNDIRPDRRQGYWQVIEIVRTPPTPPAAARPATRAVTRPGATRPATTRPVTTRPATTRPSR